MSSDSCPNPPYVPHQKRTLMGATDSADDTCQHRLIDGNRCTPWGHADDGEVVPAWEEGGYGKPLALPPNLAGSLNCSRKIKSLRS